MAVKYYEKTFEDIKLQYPPEEVIKKARPSEKSLGNDVLVTVERVEGACSAHQIEGMSWLYKVLCRRLMNMYVHIQNMNIGRMCQV